MKNEVKERDATTRAAWEQVLLEMFDEMIAQEMPMEKCELETYREMDVQSRNAEEALLCLFSTVMTKATYISNKTKSAAPLIARLHFREKRSVWGLGSACVSTLNHQGYDFRDTNLTRANLMQANLMDANLRDANLREARDWQDIRGLNLRQVKPNQRPEGWQEFFRQQGWKIEDTMDDESQIESETRTDED